MLSPTINYNSKCNTGAHHIQATLDHHHHHLAPEFSENNNSKTQMLNRETYSNYSSQPPQQQQQQPHQQNQNKYYHHLNQQPAPFSPAKFPPFTNKSDGWPASTKATVSTFRACVKRPYLMRDTDIISESTYASLESHGQRPWPQDSRPHLNDTHYYCHHETGLMERHVDGGDRNKIFKIKHNSTSTTTTTTSTIIAGDHHHHHNHLAFSDSISPNNKISDNYLPSSHHDYPQHPEHFKADASTRMNDNTDSNVAKFIKDLPVFETIEGYRVASYSIAGEPHLCLPQLLQYLRQKFTLKRMVDKFEETTINFTSATPVQVDGFKKACVLPASVQNCPLIKRSDADRICLGLYEQCFKGPKNDIVDICAAMSANLVSPHQRQDCGSKPKANDYKGNLARHIETDTSKAAATVTALNSIHQFSTPSLSRAEFLVQTIIDQHKSDTSLFNSIDGTTSATRDISQCNTINETLNKNRQSVGSDGHGGNSMKVAQFSSTSTNDNNQMFCDQKSLHSNIDADDLLPHDLSISDDKQRKQKRLTPNSKTSTPNTLISKSLLNIRDGPLFDSEAQNSILKLAEAVTSTLKIRVYHKCFGKGVGLFYPSLMKTTRSYCIECANCHIMLTPRRFIGHTHGPKEKNVCHWGFNSYHWNYYIRLSKKQPMNNLADNELLIQFKSLQSTVEPGNEDEGTNTRCSDDEDDKDYYNFDKPDLDEEVGQTKDIKSNNSAAMEPYQQDNNLQTAQQHDQSPLQSLRQHHEKLNPELWSHFYCREPELIRRNATSQKLSNTNPFATENNLSDHSYQLCGGDVNFRSDRDITYLINHRPKHQLRPSIQEHPSSHQPPPPPFSPQPLPPQHITRLPGGSSATATGTVSKRPYQALDYDNLKFNEEHPWRSIVCQRQQQFTNQYHYQETDSMKRRASNNYHNFTELCNDHRIQPTSVQALLNPPPPPPQHRYRSHSSGSKTHTLSQYRRRYNHQKNYSHEQHSHHQQHHHHQHPHQQHQQNRMLSSSYSKSLAFDKSLALAFNQDVAKRLADLPRFEMIESYRVASYSIAGEPHLCLPQLLQYLRQKFTLKRMVDKFEETVINFTSASPSQVDGFKKVCALPASAQTCPLIKRSDADRICLALYEQCFKGPKNDIVQICAVFSGDNLPHKLLDGGSDNDYTSDSVENSVKTKTTTTTIATKTNIGFHQTTSAPKLSTSESTSVQTTTIINNQYESSSTNSINSIEQLVRKHANESLSSSNTNEGPLFDSEVQNSILTLAKAVTSTLKIRVYHKCFGKCVGLFYPTLLRNFTSYCIECANCHLMLTPRRFIGHTHGPKERSVCHWGFNSYNWNSYIRLSKKQPMNNLADDELLIQFRTLLSIVESVSIEDQATTQAGDDEEYYDFDKPDLEEEVRHLEDNAQSIMSQQHHNRDYLDCYQQQHQMQQQRHDKMNSGIWFS